MREVTKTYTVYKLDELPGNIQEKVINDFSHIDTDWYEYLYEDARMIGLKITSFDIGYKQHLKAEFMNTATNTAELVLENHGETCSTFVTAKNFLNKRASVQMNIDKVTKEYDQLTEPELDRLDKLDDYLNELDDEFLKDLQHYYYELLRKEYEHIQSEAHIREIIDINEYEFLENGDIA